ncbi:uncharacterized protein At3g28850-like isoform X2 [Impatiens glandulifera]|uniref:uncharacterized protein At3g28850-like isoform X2 n=1 Tax=Impatiens glandulifera TaxID=253017 RepID=UPI001FB13F77|nr:uncharacterized protein At3g28850-like isoform X2 [Impatiens glandulifera]
MKEVLYGNLLKRLKTVKAFEYLNPQRVLLLNTSDQFSFSRDSELNIQIDSPLKEEEDLKDYCKRVSHGPQDLEIIDVSELTIDQENDNPDTHDEINDKENIKPEEINDKENIKPEEINDKENIKPLETKKTQLLKNRDLKPIPLSEIDVSVFRRPEFESNSLFDPNLLSAFHQAVSELKAREAEKRAIYQEKIQEEIQEEDKQREEEREDPLLEYKEKCPPGGLVSVILYTTGLRGIRKTFDDCTNVRFLLQNFKVLYYERDVSMHAEFRQELWQTLGDRLLPPRLFIKGRYIGGAEEVLTLHEQGRLKPLFDGLPVDISKEPCGGCGGMRFVMCYSCNGSNKVVAGNGWSPEECPECNENGLIICPFCL